MVPKEENLEIINDKIEEILKVNPDYKKTQYLIDLEKESEEPTIVNNVSNSTSGGCYVATAVYGSYNCPEVWTLRRFRDNTLAGTWYGMTFIKFYYAISPKLVKWLGNTTWFKTLWRKPLDKLVNALNRKGVENTPYQD